MTGHYLGLANRPSSRCPLRIPNHGFSCNIRSQQFDVRRLAVRLEAAHCRIESIVGGCIARVEHTSHFVGHDRKIEAAEFGFRRF